MNILKLRFLIVPLLVLSSYNFVYGQCAGTSTTIDVCTKDADVGNRNFDLFAQLGGTPATGGTWSTTNPANFVALNQTTGIVDLWRINNYGIHRFTYTNTACNQSAVVTINLGGYPGEDNIDGSANACSDDSNVNLHGFLGSNIDGKVQDFNGLWEEDPSTATNQLDNNIFNAQAAGPGIYIFTYTVLEVSSCASRTSTVILEVHPAANSGLPNSLTFCTNEDLSGYTNLDLNSRLVGEDPNGTWSENGTNQLSDLNDSFINIQELNDNFGYGTYSFTYTVFPSHPVCEEQSSVVNINILPVLDGEITTESVCFGSDYIVELTYDDTIFHNGSFILTYSVDGRLEEAPTTLTNGSGSFMVDPDLVPVNRILTLSVLGIESVSPLRDICPTILVPPTTFLAADSSVSVQDICVNNDATVTFTNILDEDGNFANGAYSTDYTLNLPTGDPIVISNAPLTFTNGSASLTIPNTNFATEGDYDIDLTITDSYSTNCPLTANFTVIPVPSPIQLDLQIDNNCDATQIDVIIDAPVLSDGSYTITYDVMEMDSNTILTTNTINFTGGTADYQIDVDALPIGNYTASVRSTQNDTTPCRLVYDFEEQENFSRGGIPEAPQAAEEQIFCTVDYPNEPTLMDIEVTSNGALLFYATATDTDILPITTLLENGEDYYISNTDPASNCEGSDRIRVLTILSDPSGPTTNNSAPIFCAEDNPTLSLIAIDSPAGSSIIWFNADVSGTLLDSTTTLVDGQTYYAAILNEQNCTSSQRLAITPTIITVAPSNLSDTELTACGLDNPTVQELRALEDEMENDVFWFLTETGGTALDNDTPLQTDTVYYAESRDPATGCSSASRVPVNVDLSACDPEDYDFFIPDGFSPNADNRNDTFFVPNIETIFPDYTIEILNRYGTTLFKGDKNNPAWDGSNGSSIAPNGIYFYIINYNKDNFEPVQGRLYLNR
ncbi:gliding motility-associated C-terminal domain-containing protein [Maribacter sedimenticola]|uniref:Gliding motility-associated C-terminal domain-containing protein n=1 Tax=Maribacter sedimenticola TaxID=228956 RepID=A0ABY1SEE3_9FLAO|nr:gliding motility-associated C-terminal domain-containing protein [Maribacter sedimenticola]SNR29446.1 gliding motility-associated C-terminal domain-containing protein [Maribacter sedimenticola]